MAVYIDTEAAVSREFLSAIGVDLSKLMVINMDNLEDIFKVMETIIISARSNSKSRLVTIVVDSVAAASTMVELDADYGKDGYATSKALILSKLIFLGKHSLKLLTAL